MVPLTLFGHMIEYNNLNSSPDQAPLFFPPGVDVPPSALLVLDLGVKREGADLVDLAFFKV